MSPAALDNEAQETRYCVPISSLTQPVEVGQIGYGKARLLSLSTSTKHPSLVEVLFAREIKVVLIVSRLTHRRQTRAGSSAFFAWPPFGPLLFENESSDARDHCANERSKI
jgi:hypothetical protein